MDSRPLTPDTLSGSVIAVPPLARGADAKIDATANQAIVRHLESGGIRTLLYGGNAVFYHLAPSEYAEVLGMLVDIAGEDTVVVPSVGPAYGTMMDQAVVLRDFDFPSVMVLPQMDVATAEGRARGIRDFADAFGGPIVVYVKHDGYLDVDTIASLVNDGCVSAIKYAVVRHDPCDDAFLKQLVTTIGGERIVSGIGEQPAIVHLRDFGLNGFTSGCVCVAPQSSMQLLTAAKAKDWDRAETLRRIFEPLEDLRNEIHPIRVLHAAVRLADVADTGPLIPLLHPIENHDEARVLAAVEALRSAESSQRTDRSNPS